MRRKFSIIRKVFTGLLFLSTLNSFAHTLDPQWLKLMRYNKNLFGYKSEVDHSNYFLSKDGKTNPYSELAASIEAFNSIETGDINKHPVCLFPGRYLYLYKKKKVKKFDLEKCSDFQYYRKKLSLTSASVIFSSYYINRPASAFGHTFLKLNQGDSLTSDLKSYGVDFSAQVNTKNPLMYGLKGIFGGFYGRFSLLPYFLKLREYNDLESRDLWEFELNFAPDELELLEAHLWDMNRAIFDYYYFTENCSYHIYRFIDAIKPDWKLWKETYTYLVPMDTVIPLVEKKDIVKNIFVRESIQKRVHGRLNQLSKKQLNYIKNSIAKNELQSLEGISDPVKVLDSLISFVDYKFPKDIHLRENSKMSQLKMKILTKRSEFEQTSSQVLKKKVDNFNYSHRPRRFKVSYLNADNINGFEVEDRSALHNILEPQGDAYSNFTLEMGRISVQYDQDREKLYFNKFTFANVTALRPFSYLEKLLSWNFSVGVKRDEFVFEEVGVFSTLGLGAAFEYSGFTFSGFIQSYWHEIGARSNLQDKLLGPSLVGNYNSSYFASQVTVEHLYDFEDEEFINQLSVLNQIYLSKRSSLSLEYEKKLDIEKLALGYIRYY